MDGRGAKASTLVPKRVQTEVKRKNEKGNSLKHHISQELSLTRHDLSLLLPRSQIDSRKLHLMNLNF